MKMIEKLDARLAAKALGAIRKSKKAGFPVGTDREKLASAIAYEREDWLPKSCPDLESAKQLLRAQYPAWAQAVSAILHLADRPEYEMYVERL